MLDSSSVKLRNPPIVEAVIDVDCDLPAGFDLAGLETAARAQFEPRYPKSQTLFSQEHLIQAAAQGASPKLTSRLSVQAFQYRQEDGKQLVQVRAQGFSFNRLAPYTGLDEYLPEIERTWRIYVDLVSPIQIRGVRLRYINRIFVPLAAGKVELDEFLKIGPRLPDEEHLSLSGFLTQQAAREKGTGFQVNLVLTAEAPENEKLPIILDIAVASNATIESITDWPSIARPIQQLRALKNRIFLNTLTEKCLDLFR